MLAAARGRVILTVALIAAVPGVSVADDPLPELTQMVRELRYEEALARAREIDRDPASSVGARLRAIELSGLAELGLGAEPAAREAFEHLLRLDPGYVPVDPRPSPRITELFRVVRERLAGSEPGRLVVSVAAPAIDGAPASVTARPTGEHAIVRVVFATSSAGLRELPAEPGGPPWRVDVPVATRRDADHLEVVARGFAPSGALCALSSVARPRPVSEVPTSTRGSTSPRPARRSRRAPEHPWVWGVVGAALVVGTVTILLIVAGGASDHPADSSSALRLEL